MSYAGEILVQTFEPALLEAGGQQIPCPAIDVVAYNPSHSVVEPGPRQGLPGYTQAALRMAGHIGIIVNRAAAAAAAASQEAGQIVPAPTEEIARKISQQLGTYMIAREGLTKEQQPLAYARIGVFRPNSHSILHFLALEALIDGAPVEQNRRAAAALMIAASGTVPPDTLVRVDGHKEIAETRSWDFFAANGFLPGRHSPEWGTPHAYCVNTVREMRERLGANYDLPIAPREPLPGVDYP